MPDLTFVVIDLTTRILVMSWFCLRYVLFTVISLGIHHAIVQSRMNVSQLLGPTLDPLATLAN